MEVTIFNKNLTKEDEVFFADYVNTKLAAIESLLTKFADDAAVLKASIEKFEKHDAFEMEFCLILPSKSIIAKEASHQINKAVDLAKDRLLSQIKKHIAHLRKDRAHQSIRNPKVRETIEVPTTVQ